MDDRVYWLWLQHAFGAGSGRPFRLSGQPGPRPKGKTGGESGARAFYEGGPKLWNTLAGITDREAAALRDFSLGEAEARLEYAEKVGWKVLTPECEKYPEGLRNIFDPPAVLYVKGNLPNLEDMPAVAVVGARHAVPASREAARNFGYQLAAGGACVVSGGALGVDASVLLGALSIPDSAVISVLPVSLDSAYLTENAKLRAAVVSRGGALVSEYFSQQSPEPGGFLKRNRLITGLSRGVLLIQAGKKSGTIIYAGKAAEQDRDLFVYPGPEGAPEFAGSRALLEEGARAVTCGEEILEEYPEPRRIKRKVLELFADLPVGEPGGGPALADSGPGRTLSQDEAVLLEALGGEALTSAQLEERLGRPASEWLGLLMELEVDGFVISEPGKRYSRAGTEMETNIIP